MVCATATAATMVSFGFRCPPTSYSSSRVCFSSVHFSPFNKTKLNSLSSISGCDPILPLKLCTVSPLPQIRPFTVVSAKGYKMKTHKASAKRFRVTGRGKIVRRRAGKQHLLGKKNTKRKSRLSKMHEVNRSDYDNVIGALPYLKVNRQAK